MNFMLFLNRLELFIIELLETQLDVYAPLKRSFDWRLITFENSYWSF